MCPKKRVLVVTASPRKNGNSTILAQKAVEGVKAAGGEAEIVNIGGMKIAPCNGCDACVANPKKGCVIEDDMQQLYPKIREAEGFILASPVYWFNMTAQMKAFIDRAYAIQGGGDWAFTGKDIGVILTYGDVDVFVSGGVNALRSFQDICTYCRGNYVGSVYGSASKPGDVKANKELQEKAFDLGKKLVEA